MESSKNKVIKPLSDSEEEDDDMPPPLEDMSDHITAIKSIKENNDNKVAATTTNAQSKPVKQQEDEPEIRLAPKKTIPMTTDDSKFESKPAQ